MKYRKRPVVINAVCVRCYEDEIVPLDTEEWFDKALKDGVIYDINGRWFCKTLEGDHGISDRDYIIQGVKGELYPCKPDIFEMTYELVS